MANDALIVELSAGLAPVQRRSVVREGTFLLALCGIELALFLAMYASARMVDEMSPTRSSAPRRAMPSAIPARELLKLPPLEALRSNAGSVSSLSVRVTSRVLASMTPWVLGSAA